VRSARLTKPRGGRVQDRRHQLQRKDERVADQPGQPRRLGCHAGLQRRGQPRAQCRHGDGNGESSHRDQHGRVPQRTGWAADTPVGRECRPSEQHRSDHATGQRCPCREGSRIGLDNRRQQRKEQVGCRQRRESRDEQHVVQGAGPPRPPREEVGRQEPDEGRGGLDCDVQGRAAIDEVQRRQGDDERRGQEPQEGCGHGQGAGSRGGWRS
jgi:hypothetical protein